MSRSLRSSAPRLRLPVVLTAAKGRASSGSPRVSTHFHHSLSGTTTMKPRCRPSIPNNKLGLYSIERGWSLCECPKASFPAHIQFCDHSSCRVTRYVIPALPLSRPYRGHLRLEPNDNPIISRLAGNFHQCSLGRSEGRSFTYGRVLSSLFCRLPPSTSPMAPQPSWEIYHE